MPLWPATEGPARLCGGFVGAGGARNRSPPPLLESLLLCQTIVVAPEGRKGTQRLSRGLSGPLGLAMGGTCPGTQVVLGVALGVIGPPGTEPPDPHLGR